MSIRTRPKKKFHKNFAIFVVIQLAKFSLKFFTLCEIKDLKSEKVAELGELK
jgi:hypothetical protein